MPYKKFIISYPSTNKEHDIHAYCLEPLDKKNIRGVVQIAHGMREYFARYHELSRFLCSKGFIVCGNDHAGHGRSLNKDGIQGYFGGNTSYHHLVYDMHRLTLIIKDKYPNLSYNLLGHSMGSFLSRAYIASFSDELDSCILSGTSAGLAVSNFAIVSLRLLSDLIGPDKDAKKINKLGTELFNHRIENRKTDSDWLSSNELVTESYINDPLVSKAFSYSAYQTLLKLLKYVNSKRAIKKISKDLPVLLISGSEDPVGNYGKDIKKLYSQMLKYGKNTSAKLYEKSRHEIINDIEKDDVYEDILNFLELNYI